MSKKPIAPRGAGDGTKQHKPSNADLRAALEQQIGPLISGGQREQVISRIMVMMSEQFHGPIAHPRHLREYEDILPGSAERIVQMAEKALEHNRKMEERIVDTSVWEAKAGMILGFAALMVLIGVGAYAGLTDRPIIAGLFVGAGVLGAATTLIRGWKPNAP